MTYLHAEHANGLKARLDADTESDRASFLVRLYTDAGEFLDSYSCQDLPQAMRAIGPGLRSGNFDRFRADERYAAMAEADTLDLY